MQDRRVYIGDVMRLAGIKTRKTIYSHVERGILPAPRKQANGRLAWLLSEVATAYAIPVEADAA